MDHWHRKLLVKGTEVPLADVRRISLQSLDAAGSFTDAALEFVMLYGSNSSTG